jgi:hypothetical protein
MRHLAQRHTRGTRQEHPLGAPFRAPFWEPNKGYGQGHLLWKHAGTTAMDTC